MSDLSGTSQPVRPSGILTKICPLVATADQKWLTELISSPEPRDLLVDLMVATQKQTLGELMPLLNHLSGEAPLFEMPQRPRNLLGRTGLDNWEAILVLEPAHIGALRNAGKVTVRDVLSWCLDHAETLARDPSLTPPQPKSTASSANPSLRPAEEDPSWSEFQRAMREIVRVARDYRGSTNIREVFEADVETLIAALGISETLEAMAVEDFTSSRSTGAQIVAILNKLFEGRRAVEIAIVEERIGVDDPPTLEEVGEKHDLTRERIRQLQSQLEQELDAAVGRLLEEIKSLWSPLLPILTTADVLEQHASQFLEIDSATSTGEKLAIRFLVQTLAYEPLGGVLISSPAAQQLDDLKALAHQECDSVGLLGESILQTAFPELASSAFWPDLLAEAGLHQIGDYLGTRLSAKAQVKAALLKIGRPATKEEIADICGLETKLLGSQLSVIDDVARADKHRWGLIDWIEDVYEGIPAEIIQRIDEDGGSTSVERLLEELPRMFEVSATSVRAYLATPQFVVREGHAAVADPSTITYRPLADVIDGHTEDGDPYWVFSVEDRYLHGYSVAGMPPEIAREFGCGPNDDTRVKLTHPENCEPVSVIWRLSTTTGGASLGYLTEPLQALGVVGGASVRLEIHKDATASIRVHKQPEDSNNEAADDILQRIKERRRVI